MLQIGILTDNENQELQEQCRPNKMRLLVTILARKNKGKLQELLSLVAKEELHRKKTKCSIRGKKERETY